MPAHKPITNGIKNCPKCCADLPITDFAADPTAKHGKRSYCKKCHSIESKNRHAKLKNTPEYVLKRWLYMIQTRYNITNTDYYRILEFQNGVCAGCRSDPGSVRSHFDIDHNHATGKFRGLLCRNCNHILGLLTDSVVSLTCAAKYLTAAVDIIPLKTEDIVYLHGISRFDRKLRRLYRISESDFNLQLTRQNYACAICNLKSSRKQHRRLVPDHCHNTSSIRGLLCSNCNTAVGLAHDNPTTLLNLAKYLQSPPAASLTSL